MINSIWNMKIVLLLICSILFVSAQASVFTDLQEIAQNKPLRGYPCHNILERNSDKLLILFEGRTSYRRKFIDTYKVVEKHHRLEDMKQAYFAHINKDWSGLSSEQGYLYKKFQEVNRVAAIRSILIASHSELEDYDVLYLPQRRRRRALKCIKNYQKKNDYSEINIIGYSQGSFAAMKVTGWLKKDGFPVSKLMTIDPVGKSTRIFKNLFSNKDSNFSFFDRGSVDYWVNFYQKNDRKSGFFGIKGNSFSGADGADINIKINADKRGHKIYRYLYRDHESRNLIESFLK